MHDFYIGIHVLTLSSSKWETNISWSSPPKFLCFISSIYLPIPLSVVTVCFDFRAYSKRQYKSDLCTKKKDEKIAYSLMKYKIKYKTLECNRNFQWIYNMLRFDWPARQTERVVLWFRIQIKKHPCEGEWLWVQKFETGVCSYTASFIFMSSWWMQCNWTLILSKSSWKEYTILSESKATRFFSLLLDSMTKVKGYH